MEAEYVAFYGTSRITQPRGFLNYLIEQDNKFTPLYFAEKQAAISLAGTTVQTKTSKHMNLRYH